MRYLNIFLSAVAAVISSVAVAETILVPSEYAHIQEAIDVAVDGDIVLVSDDTYFETIDFLGKAITISSESGIPDNVFIDGLFSSGAPVVSFATEETTTSVLEGFTIRNGSASDGAGIYINGAAPTINNCIIKSNNSSGFGAGIYVESGTLNLNNSTINGNTSSGAGGGVYLKTSDGSISNCSIQFNLANNGGGLYVKDGTGDFNITSSDIIGNEVSANAGGLYNKNSNVLVQDCSFTDNSSNKGGAWYSYSSGDATISNTIFTDNSCLESGGAANIRSSSDVTFNQCTFDTNVADSDCDGVGGSGVIEMTSNCTVILDSPTICVNLVCDVIEDFSGIEPTINGEIQGCSSGLGACCGGVACWEMTHNDCLEGGGTYSGEDTACQMVECFGTDAGACCMIDICIMAASEGACIEAGGLFQGAMILCDDEEVSCPEGCPADLSGDGSVEVNDIIELISAWGACP